MKTKRLDINFSPLKVLVSLSVPGGEAVPGSAIDGAVPCVQYYDSQEREHIPDYTIAHLVIQPSVKVLDRDGWIVDKDVTSRLTNVRWSVLNGTSAVATPVTQGPDYGIVTDGPGKWQLIVGKNVPLGESRTYVFDAEFMDYRTNQPHTIHATMLVRCMSSAEAPLRIEMNTSTAVVWDPLSRRAAQERVKRVEVWLTKDGRRADAENSYFVWYKRRPHGGWSVYGTDPMDYEMVEDASVSGDNARSGVRLIDLEKCGEGMELRVLGHYNGQGIYTLERDAAMVADIDLASVPRRTIQVVRRVHEWEEDYILPVNISPGEESVRPRAFIRDSDGPLGDEDVDRALLIKWHTRATSGGVALAWEHVAEGLSPVVSTSKMHASQSGYKMELGMDVAVRPPLGVWMTPEDEMLTDSDGSLLLI